MMEAWVMSFGLMLVRISAFWMVLPIWSAIQVPRMVKLGLILALTVFWFQGLQQPTAAALFWANGSLHWFFLVLVVARELVFGAIMGMAFLVFLVPAKIAGAYIGQELGLSMATLTDATSGAADNIVATLFYVFAVTLFFVMDLHHYFIYFLDASFAVVPAGSAWDPNSIGTAILGLAKVTTDGLVIASPIAIVSLVTIFALLLLARTAPALNLFSVGIPVRLLVGLGAIVFFLPSIIVSLNQQFSFGLQFLRSILL